MIVNRVVFNLHQINRETFLGYPGYPGYLLLQSYLNLSRFSYVIEQIFPVTSSVSCFKKTISRNVKRTIRV